MRKFLLGAVLSLLLFVPVLTFAQLDLGGDLVSGAASRAGYAEATDTTFAETIGTVIKAFLSFVGVIFLVLMVYAGFLWMNARGDESQVEKAQDIIRAAIIGMAITVGAYSITAFVVPRIVEKTAGPASDSNGGTNNNNAGDRVGCCELCEVAGPLGFCAGNSKLRIKVDTEDECKQRLENSRGEFQAYQFGQVSNGSCH